MSQDNTPNTGPVSGQMSDKPLLDNHWGNPDPNVPINYHTDGAIGTALERMGNDAHGR